MKISFALSATNSFAKVDNGFLSTYLNARYIGSLACLKVVLKFALSKASRTYYNYLLLALPSLSISLYISYVYIKNIKLKKLLFLKTHLNICLQKGIKV